MEIQDRFKTLRKNLKLNQTQFGERIGATKDIISNIEMGRVPPKPLLIKLIVNTFKVNKEWLVNGVGSMFLIDQENLEVEELLYKISQENSELYPKALKLSKLSVEDLKLIDGLMDRLLEKEKEN